MKQRFSGLFAVPIAALALSGCMSNTSSNLPNALPISPTQPPSTSPIKHVVIIVQENRSFDNFFATFPGASGATRGKMKVKQGSKWVDKWVTLKSHPLLMKTDVAHCHSSFATAYDGGKMDGFNLVPWGSCGNGKAVGTAVYQYVSPSQIQPYWDIAEMWVLADHMFQTQGSGSFTAHQDLIRGGTAISSSASLIDSPTGWPWGCDASNGVKTWTISTSGKIAENGPFPCSNKFPMGSSSYETMRDLFDGAGLSWKYYAPCNSHTSGCAPSGPCPNCNGDLLNAFDVIHAVRYGSEWRKNVSMPETNIFTDISSGSLPAVSWVIPGDNNSDHPGETSDNGPAWVASVVNAVGESNYWNSSAIFVLWDDWGGFYDNLKPPFQDNQGGLGFRVPALVISPYDIPGNSSQGGSISHTQYEFASILKFIEQNWGLGSLGTTDGRAKTIGDVFNYNQSPRTFVAIPSNRSIKFFKQEALLPQHGDPE